MAKQTQVELLREIADLLLPVSNLAKFNITQINQQIAAQEEKAKKEAEDGTV